MCLRAVASLDTLLLVMFLGWANEWQTKQMFCFYAAQTGKHLLRTQNVSERNKKHFLCPQEMLCVRTDRETFVSATLCSRMAPP